MQLNKTQQVELEDFFNNSRFSTNGGVVTDLDGTAVHEFNGKIVIHTSVELGLKKMHHLGRPIIINTLRFPLSVIRTFGKEWYTISNAPIPVILLNGSQLGYVVQTQAGGFEFEQVQSFPLTNREIDEALNGVRRLLAGKVTDLVIFYYPEDWKMGEIIWTPVPKKIPLLQQKYQSASSVISTSFEELKRMMFSQPVCMIFLLIELETDKLMAYQHTRRSNFITRKNVDKLFGTERMAGHLGIDLYHSIGAGDSEMDSFLNGVGLSVHVGNRNLKFKGISQTMKLPGYAEFGDLLFRFADMQQAVTK